MFLSTVVHSTIFFKLWLCFWIRYPRGATSIRNEFILLLLNQREWCLKQKYSHIAALSVYKCSVYLSLYMQILNIYIELIHVDGETETKGE